MKLMKCGKLFRGIDERVETNMAILVEGNRIKKILPIESCAEMDAEVIDLQDRFVMPGLIDAHVHCILSGELDADHFYTRLPGDFMIKAIKNEENDLLAGFTTVRDVGSMHYVDISLRDAINRGELVGPRMVVSGTGISSLGGHGDGHMAPQIQGASSCFIVKDEGEARAAARTNFKHGADALKLFGTGGVMTFGDEPGAQEMTFTEMKAAIEIANNKGKTSCIHAHGASAIKDAIRAGITSIEHGMMIDEEGMQMMLESGTYMIPTIIAANNIVEAGKEGKLPAWMVDKAQECLDNHGAHVRKMHDMGVKIGFGSDAGTAFNMHGEQAVEFELMTHYGFSNAEALLAATKVNAALIRKQNDIGSIEEGKFADVAAFNGDATEDISVMKNCTFVMKDGAVIKNICD